jgi:deoxyhypusine synthase
VGPPPAPDSTDIWGEFREEVALPIGDVAVFLGEASPEDGSLSGITIDLTVS